jgi:PAS domain S-box-containing protein
MTHLELPSADHSLPVEMLAAWAQQERQFGLVFLSPTGIVTALSPSAVRLLGYQPDVLVGRSFADFFTRTDQALGLHLLELELAEQRGYAEDDRWHRRKDGSLVWVSGCTTAIREEDGRLRGFVKVMRDRTDLRADIEELQRRCEHSLEVRGFPAREPQQRGVPSLLEAVLSDAVRGCQAHAQSAACQIHLTVPPEFIRVKASHEPVLKIFSTLIDNAIAHSPGGHVWLEATTQGNEALIHCEDTGEGIEGSKLEKIFALFTHEAPEELIAEPGTLASIHGLVRAQGGSINVRSAGAGKGANFGVRLPLYQHKQHMD